VYCDLVAAVEMEGLDQNDAINWDEVTERGGNANALDFEFELLVSDSGLSCLPSSVH
jgi:hypothetical protein